MTVGGESDKVKPNGKNWLNPSSNRPCPPGCLCTLRRDTATPGVIGFPVLAAAVRARANGVQNVMLRYVQCDANHNNQDHNIGRAALPQPNRHLVSALIRLSP